MYEKHTDPRFSGADAAPRWQAKLTGRHLASAQETVQEHIGLAGCLQGMAQKGFKLQNYHNVIMRGGRAWYGTTAVV